MRRAAEHWSTEDVAAAAAAATGPLTVEEEAAAVAAAWARAERVARAATMRTLAHASANWPRQRPPSVIQLGLRGKGNGKGKGKGQRQGQVDQ